MGKAVLTCWPRSGRCCATSSTAMGWHWAPGQLCSQLSPGTIGMPWLKYTAAAGVPCTTSVSSFFLFLKQCFQACTFQSRNKIASSISLGENMLLTCSEMLQNALNKHCQCLLLNIREPGKESSTLTVLIWKHLCRFNTCLQHPSGMKPQRYSKCQKCRHRIWRGNSQIPCNFEEKLFKRSLIRQKTCISDSSLPP